MLGSPITWDGVFPSVGTGVIPCRCCPGIPVVPRQGGGLRRRKAGSKCGKGWHPGGAVACAWLLPDTLAGGYGGGAWEHQGGQEPEELLAALQQNGLGQHKASQ